MNELLQFSGDNTQKMTSKEIAELTGKEHSNVMRDIRKA
jgi:phage regulator Rha-like protein